MSLTNLISAALSGCTIDNSNIGQTTPANANFLTPATDDNSQKAATTAWVRAVFDSLASENGYVKLPNGLIIQWGVAPDPNDSTIVVNFPTAFPTACFTIVGTNYSSGNNRIVSFKAFNTTNFTVTNDGSSNGVLWIAIGY